MGHLNAACTFYLCLRVCVTPQAEAKILAANLNKEYVSTDTQQTGSTGVSAVLTQHQKCFAAHSSRVAHSARVCVCHPFPCSFP